jgi:phosphohistidine swiveling domain-containing protein
MKTRTLSTKEKKQKELNQNVLYSHLTDLQLMDVLEKLIQKASTTEGMESKSATEILLEDRR